MGEQKTEVQKKLKLCLNCTTRGLHLTIPKDHWAAMRVTKNLAYLTVTLDKIFTALCEWQKRIIFHSSNHLIGSIYSVTRRSYMDHLSYIPNRLSWSETRWILKVYVLNLHKIPKVTMATRTTSLVTVTQLSNLPSLCFSINTTDIFFCSCMPV